MDLRPVVRYVANRSWFLRKLGVRFRLLAHLLVGNPHQLIIAFYGLAVWDFYNSILAALAAWASMVVAAELVLQFVRVRGISPTLLTLVGWREAWRVRRRWPTDWAVLAAKTINVQAEVGTSEEPKAPAFRPICDHPKLSWIPRIHWPVITWWVGPPPGRSFQALEATTSILAANISHCQQIRVEFARASDSYGRLIMIFDELDSWPDWWPPVGADPVPELDSGTPTPSPNGAADTQSLRLVPQIGTVDETKTEPIRQPTVMSAPDAPNHDGLRRMR